MATTSPSFSSDSVIINGRKVPGAQTTLKVVELMRRDFGFGSVLILHEIEPPVGAGFGTSGSGSLGAACSISDLFELGLTLSQASEYAHAAEVLSLTGLGTVISLASGLGPVGLVTEAGSFSVGRTDSLLCADNEYSLVCAHFGAIEKSTVLRDDAKRLLVNTEGRNTLEAVLREPTPEALLRNSLVFAQKTGLITPYLLQLAENARKLGAVGATQNMIGNAIHCLVRTKERVEFLRAFSKILSGGGTIFVSQLSRGGPRFV